MLEQLRLAEASGRRTFFSIKRHCKLMQELQPYFEEAEKLIKEFYTNEHGTAMSLGDLRYSLQKLVNCNVAASHLMFAKQIRSLSPSDRAKRFQTKIKATNMKNYGVEFSWQREDVKNSIRSTNLRKYGAESFFATEKFRTTYENNCLNKYGVTNHSKRVDVISKIQQTIYNNHGCYGSWNANKQQQLDRRHLMSYLRCKEQLDEENIQLLSKFSTSHGSKNIDGKNWKTYKFLCLKCMTEFTSTFANFVHCPNCYDSHVYYKTSKLENQIVDFLKNSNIKTITTDRKILKPLELDIYLPQYKMAFEIDGVYFHQYKDKQYHRFKTIKCLEKGINLYHLRDSYGLDKCLSFVKQKLGLCEKIYARLCSIKQISYKDAKIFFDENHLHNNTMHSLAFGLYYNNILVSAIAFRKNKNDIEIARYATKLNLSVIGGFSKLLKHSLQQLQFYYPNVKKLITYCDRDISPDCTKTVYAKNGFKFIHDSGPSLTFFKDGIFYSRQMLQKHKLKDLLPNYDASLSAQQNCINHRYFPCWNSGNFKYQLVFNKENNVC